MERMRLSPIIPGCAIRARAILRGLLFLLCAFLFCNRSPAQNSHTEKAQGTAYRADRLLIKPKPQTGPARLARTHAALGCKVLRTFERFGGVQVLALPNGGAAQTFVSKYQ